MNKKKILKRLLSFLLVFTLTFSNLNTFSTNSFATNSINIEEDGDNNNIDNNIDEIEKNNEQKELDKNNINIGVENDLKEIVIIETNEENLKDNFVKKDNLTDKPITIEKIKLDKENIVKVSNLEELSKEIIELNENEISNKKIKNYDVENKFTTKRILVLSKNSFNTYNAINVVNYDDLYILTYENEIFCEKAYNELLKNESLLSVEIDSIIETSSTLKNGQALKNNENPIIENKEKENSIVVGIIDSGIDLNNPLFDNNIIDLGINLSTTGEENSIQDDNGHGTAVASIIAKNSNAKMLPIKVANADGKGTVLNLYLGIEKAIENNVDVINLSLTTTAQSTLLETSIQKCKELGILVVAAAGNDSANVENYAPANIESAFTIAATNEDYSIAEYSNYGSFVDYSAIGTNVEVETLNGTTTMNGTSLATAYITSIISNILEENKNSSKIVEKNEILYSFIETSLEKYCYDFGEVGRDDFYGKGIISLDNIDNEENNKNKDDILDFDFKIKQSLLDDTRDNYKLEIITNNLKDYSFTFDGGETWQSENFIEINRLEEFYIGNEYLSSIRNLGIKNSKEEVIFKNYQVIDCNNPKDAKSQEFNLAAEGIDTVTTETGIAYYDTNIDNNVTYVESKFIYNISTKTATILSVSNSNSTTNRFSIPIPENMYVKYNGTKITLTVTEVGDGENPVLLSLFGDTGGNNTYIITRIVIPITIKRINDHAFKNFQKLKVLRFRNDSVCNYIGDYAFYGCSALENIQRYTDDSNIINNRFPASLLTVGDYAFYDCSSLKTLHLGGGVNTLGENTFRGTTQLENVTINSDIRYHNNAFKNYNSIKTLTFGTNCTTIYRNMFENCTGITSLQCNTSIVDVQQEAFLGCTGLCVEGPNTNSFAEDIVKYPANVEFVGRNAFAFYGKINNTEYDLPEVEINQSVEWINKENRIAQVNIQATATSTQLNKETKKDYIFIVDTTASMNGKTVVIDGKTMNFMDAAKLSLKESIKEIANDNEENRICIISMTAHRDCVFMFWRDCSLENVAYMEKLIDKQMNYSSGPNHANEAWGESGPYTIDNNGNKTSITNTKRIFKNHTDVTDYSTLFVNSFRIALRAIQSKGTTNNTYGVVISDGIAGDLATLPPYAEILRGSIEEVWAIGIGDYNATKEETLNTVAQDSSRYTNISSTEEFGKELKQWLSNFFNSSLISVKNATITQILDTGYWDFYEVPKFNNADESGSSGSGSSGGSLSGSANVGGISNITKNVEVEVENNSLYIKNLTLNYYGIVYSYKIQLKENYKNLSNRYLVSDSIDIKYNVKGLEYILDNPFRYFTVNNDTQHSLDWETYNITYNPNGGTGNTTTQAKPYGESISIKTNNFTRTGYTFNGWNTNSSGNGTTYAVGQSYNTNANLTLYAQWKIHTSTLKVNPNGGTWNGYTTTQSYTQNYNTTKSIPKPTIINYTATFNGNGGTSGSSSKATNKTFSTWTRTNTYGTMSSLTTAATYTFGHTNGVTDTITASYSGNYNITLPSATRVGHTFNGWYTATSGGTKIGNSGDIVTLSSNVTYYAQWTPYTSTLKVNPNGGTWNGYTTIQSYTQNYNTSKNIPNPTIVNYTITLDATGGTVTTSKISSNREFTSWTKSEPFYGTLNETTYTFGHTNGVTDTLTANYSGNYNITLPTPTRESYIFKGWYTSEKEGRKIGDGGTTITATTNATYYAQWIEDKYNVTYIDVVNDINGEVLNKTIEEKNYGIKVSGEDKGTNVEDNYYYNGYYYVSSTSEIVDKDVTVYRIFKLRTVEFSGTIYWNDWDNKNGSRPNNVVVSIKTEDTTPRNTLYLDNRIVVEKDKNWEYSIELPKYNEDGNIISYIISQEKSISQVVGLEYLEPEKEQNGYVCNFINNITTVANYSLLYNIIWEDENDYFKYRPETININLYKNNVLLEEKTLVTKETDKYIVENLYKYDENGELYLYEVKPLEVDRYDIEVKNNDIIYTFIAPNYNVVIPKSIVLDGTTGIGEYVIKVNGNIDNRDSIYVVPDETFVMSDMDVIYKNAFVEQSLTKFDNVNNLVDGIESLGKITLENIKAGNWKGQFNFNIYYEFGN